MPIFVMPVRAQHDPPVDDWVIWSIVVETPTIRGTRAEIEQHLAEKGMPRHEAVAAFIRAERTGTSALLAHGCWGDRLRVMEGGGSGLLPRDQLREFCDVLFADDPDTTRAATMLEQA